MTMEDIMRMIDYDLRGGLLKGWLHRVDPNEAGSTGNAVCVDAVPHVETQDENGQSGK